MIPVLDTGVLTQGPGVSESNLTLPQPLVSPSFQEIETSKSDPSPTFPSVTISPSIQEPKVLGSTLLSSLPVHQTLSLSQPVTTQTTKTPISSVTEERVKLESWNTSM